MNSAIQIRDLKIRFRNQVVLRDLELDVPEGSISGLIGPNGAGKTTTLATCVGLYQPDAGEARILGTPSTDLRDETLSRVGFFSDFQRLPGAMTPRQWLGFLRGSYPTWDDTYCRQLLEAAQIPRDRRLRRLSKGMRAWVQLISCLSFRPELLILDEPFGGLDAFAREEVVEKILELVSVGTTTVVLATHDLAEIESLIDHLAIVATGRVRLAGPMDSIRDRFRSVEAVLHGPAWDAGPSLPTWNRAQRSGRTLRFVETEYVPGRSEALIRERFEVRELKVRCMSLQEIFRAVAAPRRRPGLQRRLP